MRRLQNAIIAATLSKKELRLLNREWWREYFKENLMVNLYEPDGTLNGNVSRSYAIEYCQTHPGWYWAEV